MTKTETCPICEKRFAKPSLLARHSVVHTKESQFECAECHKRFGQKSTLKTHLFQHFNNPKFACKKCDSLFTQKVQLQRHYIRVHTNKTPFPCEKCSSHYKTLSSLNSHLKKCHPRVENSITPPDDIGQILEQLGQLQPNLRAPTPAAVSENKAQVVDLADRAPSGEVVLKRFHVRTSGDQKVCVCDFCCKEMKKPSDMVKHLRTHTREKPYICHHCHFTFSQKSSIRHHIVTFHQSREDNSKYFCQICGLYFRNIDRLSRHSLVHNDENFSYQCAKCLKTFETFVQLRNHIKWHNRRRVEPVTVKAWQNGPDTERKFVCQSCGAAFKKQKYLGQHEETHRSGQSFTCGQCGKAFATKRCLDQHAKLHLERKKIGCPECAMEFFTTAKLKRHVARRHSVQESATISIPILAQPPDNFTVLTPASARGPKDCTFCGKSFKKPIDLRRHLRTHTNSKPFACPDCPKTFTLKCTLDRHRDGQHKQAAARPSIVCDVCAKVFKSLTAKNVHMRIHFDVRNFACTYCSMRFLTSGHLKSHHQAHMNIFAKHQGAVALEDTRTKKFTLLELGI